jgi:hypothetical protein
MLRLFRLFRLMKVGRAIQIGKVIQIAEDVTGFPPASFDLVKMLAQVYLIAHYMACIWWALCRLSSDRGNQWYSNEDMVYVDLADSSTRLSIKYTASLYWTFTTMTTIGYG